MQGFEKTFERIKFVTGWTKQQELTDFLEISASAITGPKKRNTFPLEWAFRVAQKFKVSTDWLLTGEEMAAKFEMPLDGTLPTVVCSTEKTTVHSDEYGNITIPRWQNPDPEMFDYIPMAEAQLSAGGGAFVISEEIEGYYAFRKSWLRRVASSSKNLVLMRVIGDSMSPTIQQDDTVMIDIGNRTIKEGMIYAIRFDSTIMVKRLAYRPGGRVLIISDNRQEYESYEAELKDLHIIGQIIFFCRTFATE